MEAAVVQIAEAVLLVGSRTYSGGDAYAMCNLLLGNPDLVVLTSEPAMTPPTEIFFTAEMAVRVHSVDQFRVCHFPPEGTDVRTWAVLKAHIDQRVDFAGVVKECKACRTVPALVPMPKVKRHMSIVYDTFRGPATVDMAAT